MIRIGIALAVVFVAMQILAPSDAVVVAVIALALVVGPMRVLRFFFGLALVLRALAGP